MKLAEDVSTNYDDNDLLMPMICWCHWFVGANDLFLTLICWCQWFVSDIDLSMPMICWCQWFLDANDSLMPIISWCHWFVDAIDFFMPLMMPALLPAFEKWGSSSSKGLQLQPAGGAGLTPHILDKTNLLMRTTNQQLHPPCFQMWKSEHAFAEQFSETR